MTVLFALTVLYARQRYLLLSEVEEDGRRLGEAVRGVDGVVVHGWDLRVRVQRGEVGPGSGFGVWG